MVARPSRRQVGALALGGAAALTVGKPAIAADPIKIRIAWSVAPAQLAPLMGDPGVTKHMGKSYTLEPQRVPGSGATLTALGAGELDIAPMTFIQLGPAIHNAGMTDLRVVADEFRDGFEDYNTNEYMVLKDGPIQKIEDLKGNALFSGVRGRAPIPTRPIADLLCQISEMIAAIPEIAEIDINPLIVSESGAGIADARVVLTPAAAREAGARSHAQPAAQ